MADSTTPKRHVITVSSQAGQLVNSFAAIFGESQAAVFDRIYPLLLSVYLKATTESGYPSCDIEDMRKTVERIIEETNAQLRG